ncbi:MAG TPA: hypothetical protein VFQ65_06280 [Kofleriaceae bacterium]|nr:hypothetical protein [Kofleriaceae bacterium]
MMKLSIACALALLCTPALADPAPAPPTMKVGFKVDGGKDQRHYTVELVDKACGEVSNKSSEPAHGTSTRDQIKVCATVEKTGVRLSIEWELHDGTRDISNKSEMLVARGGTQELDGGTAKLAVTLQ